MSSTFTLSLYGNCSHIQKKVITWCRYPDTQYGQNPGRRNPSEIHHCFPSSVCSFFSIFSPKFVGKNWVSTAYTSNSLEGTGKANFHPYQNAQNKISKISSIANCCEESPSVYKEKRERRTKSSPRCVPDRSRRLQRCSK